MLLGQRKNSRRQRQSCHLQPKELREQRGLLNGKTMQFQLLLTRSLQRNNWRNISAADSQKVPTQDFPALAKLARIILSIPSSSGSSERAFSVWSHLGGETHKP
ncbi:hypothetical protein ILYODFUR_033288 [Ilyodon furcidens]|uniref:HAT C-terminal dimerisation domain-containing protein n=1 Tax=Ilyodon furcidens TaxID=33524 RepID=A0ABV0VJU0_9TELE